MNLETKITIYKFTPQLFTLTQFMMVVLWFEKVWISLKTWGNLFFFVENTVELLKKNYICTIHY